MVQEKVFRQLIRPAAVPVGVFLVAAAIIITIGETLIGLSTPGKPELERVELWVAVAFSLLILGLGAAVARMPRGAAGPFEREVAIGHRPMFAEPLPPVDVAARNGPLGTVDDIGEGYTLYARSGALARVVGMVGGSEEFGRRHRAFIYAKGLFGASDELWIPVEAVMSVYPETHSVFLAIKGDETETFGWNRPPENFRRGPRPPELPKAL